MNPPSVILRKVGKKNLISKKFFFILSADSKWFFLCIFESDTVKSDNLGQIFRKMMKYLKITLLVLLFFWRY